MDNRRNDIEKYLKGELTPAERHALEKEALNDPFLADALEGAEGIGAADFSKDVAALHEKILKRKPATVTWFVRIAATVLLLTVSAFIVWMALKPEPEQTLALKQNTPATGSLPTASTKSDTTAGTQELNAAPLIAESKKETLPQPKQRSKKTSPGLTTKKTELLTASSEPVRDEPSAKEKVVAPTATNPLNNNQKIATLDPNKKNELQPPSAAEIKLAEGYIESVEARPTIVTGRVLSADDGMPLADVSVALKGTSVITKTDAHGRYAITASSRDKTLVYSSDGLERTEVKFEGIDSTYLPVKLEVTEEAVVETSGMRDFGPTNVYTIPAHPETGNRAFKQYLIKNHTYPQEAKETKVEGTVTIEFKVDATGVLSEFKIVRGIGKGCDEELIRLILQGAKWVPTTKDGIPVNDKARVKFKFELEE